MVERESGSLGSFRLEASPGLDGGAPKIVLRGAVASGFDEQIKLVAMFRNIETR